VQEPVMKAGRFLNDRDIADSRKIAIIGEGVIKQLYKPGTQPIGSYIEVNGIYFLVVGVFGTRQSGSNGDQITNRIHIPFTTFQRSFNTGNRVGWFAITGKPDVEAEVLEAKVRELLAKRHTISPDDKMAIGSWNAGKNFRKVTNLFLGINIVMWIAGLFSLAAGVIGVSNIMLISVRERTKEIGVRKALGATPMRIVRMIVAEAIVLTTMAGYLGVFWGTLVTEILDFLLANAPGDIPFAPALLDITIGGVAAVMIAVFGALAGVIPAYHAAKIQPIEALRTE
jgi:putative ABC transport system permease protein